jgi:hypothetical protein
MREGIAVAVSGADRARLEAIVADRNNPQKHVWRARIVLLTADGLGTAKSCAGRARIVLLTADGLGTAKSCAGRARAR